MEPGCDVIEKLLQTTGLSCEDLLAKLQQYRSVKTKSDEESTSNSLEKETNQNEKPCANNEVKCKSDQESTVCDSPLDKDANTSNCDSVILETKSSTVDFTNNEAHVETDTKAQAEAETIVYVESETRLNEAISVQKAQKIINSDTEEDAAVHEETEEISASSGIGKDLEEIGRSLKCEEERKQDCSTKMEKLDETTNEDKEPEDEAKCDERQKDKIEIYVTVNEEKESQDEVKCDEIQKSIEETLETITGDKKQQEEAKCEEMLKNKEEKELQDEVKCDEIQKSKVIHEPITGGKEQQEDAKCEEMSKNKEDISLSPNSEIGIKEVECDEEQKCEEVVHKTVHEDEKQQEKAKCDEILKNNEEKELLDVVKCDEIQKSEVIHETITGGKKQQEEAKCEEMLKSKEEIPFSSNRENRIEEDKSDQREKCEEEIFETVNEHNSANGIKETLGIFTENVNYTRKIQITETSKTLEDIVNHDRDNEDHQDSSFSIYLSQRNKSKRKISDYLEKLFNCGKKDAKDKEFAAETDSTNGEDCTKNDDILPDVNVDREYTSKKNKEIQNDFNQNEDKTAEENSNKNDLKTSSSARALEETDVQNIAKVSDHDYTNPAFIINSQEETETRELQKPDFSEVDGERGASTSNNEDVPKSEENLRDIIRMQLSSLRNMKKSSGYLPDLKKPSLFLHNLKKKRKSSDVNSAVTSDDKEESNDTKDISTNENSLVSLTDETDFVILNVTGGVERISPDITAEKEERKFAAISEENSECKDRANELSSDDLANQDGIRRNYISTEKSESHATYKKRRYRGYLEANDTRRFGEERLPKLTIKKNMSENFKQDPGVSKSVKNSEKSPFVSDSLEDFLKERAQLKISYSIPKLGAEEGITENTKKCPFDDVNKSEPSRIEPPKTGDVVQKEPKLVKAKTLAEMRRQFEKMKAREKVGKNTPEPLIRHKKNKVFKKYAMKAKENLKNEARINSRGDDFVSHRNSFLMFNNKKIWITSKNKDKCVGVVSSTVTKEEKKSTAKTEPSPNRKPSLLSSLTQKKPKKIIYKAGPLCKKANLQNLESRDQWTTEVKTLPKIYLEVVPEVEKPIDPNVAHLLPIFDEAVITEERLNFALSALKIKDTTSELQTFTFHIPYNNKQEQIIVRKPCKPVIYKGDSEKKQTDPEGEIASVLSDIITYIETKEIEDTIMKEDDFVEEPSETNETSVKIKKFKLKRKKLDLELRRLNCKVIDVGTNESEDEDCTKPFCKLGCVCKSLLCENVFSNHCQLVECMFGCKCTSAASGDIAKDNSLSVHMVNHLKDKAQKNLAKVEREFTQTLIHTDNDAIFVGTAKVRRSLKTPKKYTDFVGEDFDYPIPTTVSLRGPRDLQSCCVVLQKAEFDDIIPFCLFHNMYNCHCKGETVISPRKMNEGEQIPKIRIVKTKEDLHKSWFESCARIRRVFSEYKERNRNPLYTKLLNKNVENKRNLLSKDKFEDELTSQPALKEEEMKKPNKRKQSFAVLREDVLLPKCSVKRNKEFALQRRKKKMKKTVTTTAIPTVTGVPTTTVMPITTAMPTTRAVPVPVPKPVVKYNPVFDGEIKISLKDNEEMLTVIGPHNKSLEYLRILPWMKLIELFKSRKINIWTRERKSPLLLCNTAGYFPPKDFIDIRKVEDKSEIIQWILTDNLPPDRPRDLMHLILTPKKFNFLIAGHCLKKMGEKEKGQELIGTSSGTINLEVDPLEISDCVDSGDFENVYMEQESPEADRSGTATEQEIRIKEISPTFVSSRISSRVANRKKQQSVLINKILESEVARISALPNKVPLGRKLKIVKPGILPINTTLRPFSADVKKSQLGSPDKRKKQSYIKLKSILNTISSVSASTANVQNIFTQRSITDAERLKASLHEESSSVSMEIDSIFLDDNPEKHKGFGTEISAASFKGRLMECSKSNENQSYKRKRDPLAIEENEVGTFDENSDEIHMSKRLRQSPSKPSVESTRISQQCLIPSRSLKCTHKDMYNKNKTLVLTNKVFPKRTMFCNKDGKGVELVAPLPPVCKTVRWRMIYLNSDFSFLMFSKANYSIKYTDLMDVVKMSANIKSTIALRNKEFADHYKHAEFGIFCLPDFQDRLFIGPYSATENHDIETLRYLQGRLIETQIFNKMIGKKGNDKDPVWVYESGSNNVDIPKDIVIDITEEDEIEEVTVVELDSDSADEIQGAPNFLDNSLLCAPFAEELSVEEYKKKYTNRYIVTNIPHLGYLRACQRDSRAIEVFWPSGSQFKGFRFPNVTFAKNLLTQHLSQFFLPIPKDFKINVIIVTNLDVQINKPIDAKYFLQGGPFFCGDFGVHEKEAVPGSLLRMYNIPSIDSLIKEHQEAEENEDLMVRIFGLFLMSNEELRKHSEPANILQWAISEIYILKKLSDNYESEKRDLQNMIHVNSRRIKEKPGEEKSENVVKIRAINLSEPIEIEDSDDEDKEDAPPVFKKICTSGKINSSLYNKNKDRSLLKSNVWINPRRSLLKTNEEQEKEKSPEKPVQVSLNNSNMVLSKSKILLTKIK